MTKALTTIDARVLEVVRAVLPGGAGTAGLDLDTDLWQAGMTSLVSVSLMVGIEDEFGVEFPDELLRRETFNTAATIAAAVLSLEGAR